MSQPPKRDENSPSDEPRPNESADAPGAAAGSGREKEIDEALLKIWEKAVDTQMHFNEMSTRTRQIGLTFVVSALGFAVVFITKGEEFAWTYKDWRIHASVVIAAFSAGTVRLMALLDLGVYHRMLRGAVTFGEDLEENYIRKRFLNSPIELRKGMTQAISHFSRYADAVPGKRDVTGRYEYPTKILKRKGISEEYVSDEKFRGMTATDAKAYEDLKKRSAEQKIKAFYNWLGGVLLVIAAALFGLDNCADVKTGKERSTTTAAPSGASMQDTNGFSKAVP